MKKLINKIISFFKKKEVVAEVKPKAKSVKPKTPKK
jgi:hypothetical protein